MEPVLIAVALVALLLFWAVGAHNRLVRLRAAVVCAFEPLDSALARRLDWVQDGLPVVLRDLDGDPASAAWTRVRAAGAQAVLALAQVRRQPGGREAMAGLALARGTLEDAWTQARLSWSSPLSGSDPLGAKWAEWQHTEAPLALAFDQAVESYNAAVGQFPARVLARLSGLPLAGPLGAPRAGP